MRGSREKEGYAARYSALLAASALLSEYSAAAAIGDCDSSPR